MLNRLSILKTFLWAAVGVLAAVTVIRFTRGLGAVTNLSDAAPWGLWVGFDVMAGVALAAGGFVLAGTVYIFGLEQYRPFVRPAILTALLGYLAVAIGLLYDLGLPWHIWHPMIHWQHCSVLFEVAMCVMLYLTVLSLEFAPVILEHPLFARPLFQKIHRALRKATIFLIVAGIVLSTLHQSSLGSLFLITPFRLHALWYSPIIYVLFFVSAVAIGLMTVALESLLSAYFFDHKVPTRLLSHLGLAAAGVLGLYLALRLGDLAIREVLLTELNGSWHSYLFIFELAVSAIIPMSLLLFRRVRSSVAGLAVCAGLTVFGMVLNRIDVCIVAFDRSEGMGYFPSWMEIAVSLGIVSGGVLIFIFFVERFKVFEEGEATLPETPPSYDPATVHALLPDELAAPRRYSLVAIGAAAAAVLFLPVQGAEPIPTLVLKSRAVEGFSAPRDDRKGRILALTESASSTQADSESRPLLMIDGNRDGILVLFDHENHVERMGSESSCAMCHHLSLPLDCNSSCCECHRDMYETTPLFDHASHVAKVRTRGLEENGGPVERISGLSPEVLDIRAARPLDAIHRQNDNCSECHTNYADVKNVERATACAECHEYQAIADPIIEAPGERWGEAASYKRAMHQLCITCHQKSLDESPEQFSSTLDRCDYCHDADRLLELEPMIPSRATHDPIRDDAGL